MYNQITYILRESLNTILSIFKIIISSKRSARVKASKNGQCIILLNGPSLKYDVKNNLDVLKNNDLICVNTFPHNELFSELKPKGLIVLDGNVWRNKGTVFEATVNNLLKVDWNLTVYVPQFEDHNVLSKLATNNNIKIKKFNYTVFKGFLKIGFFFYKIGLACPQFKNVAGAAIFNALLLGYSKIYITGIDHSLHKDIHVDNKNNLFIRNIHFYENEEKVILKPIIIDKKKGIPLKVHELFDLLSRTFYSYQVINKFAMHINAKVYNSSNISYIDAFKRVPLDEIE